MDEEIYDRIIFLADPELNEPVLVYALEGWIDAGLGTEAMAHIDQAYIERFLGQIPLRRVGEADEIAQAVTFLLSDKAKYMTGATLPVAGGLQL